VTTPAQIRKAALALPGVDEAVEGRQRTYTVAGAVVAVVTPDADLRIPGRQDVALAGINGMESNALVRQAWYAAAPESLTARLRAAEEAVAGEVGDLPKSIGTPATRALVERGITCLADLDGITGETLASWHGVGPKAVQILRGSR
jgi:hypothetical protein